MKRMIKIFLVLAVLFSLVGCDERLETPTNVRISDDILLWNQVTNANEYVVKVGEELYTVPTNSFNLLDLELAEGTYQVSVRAISNGDLKDSRFSDALNYVVGIRTLDKPTNLVITDGVLTWNRVSGSIQYKISINGVEITTYDLVLDLTPYVMAVDSYPVTVVAIGNGIITFDSDPAQITLNFDQNLLKQTTNKMIDFFLAPYGYRVGMRQSDFSYENEYQYYLETLEEYTDLVNALANSEISFNTVKGALAIIEDLSDAQDPLFIIQTLVQSISDLGLTSNQIATFVLHVNKMYIEDEIKRLEKRQAYLDEYLADQQAWLDHIWFNLEIVNIQLETFLEMVGPEYDDSVRLINEYFELILSLFDQIDHTIEEYYNYASLIDLIENLVHYQYLLEKELAKGEAADPISIGTYQNGINYYNIEIEYRIKQSSTSSEILETIKEILIEIYYPIIVYEEANPDIYVEDVYYYYDNAFSLQMRYQVYQFEYDEEARFNEQQKANLQNQIRQYELMLEAYDHDSLKALMKMSIEQILNIYEEINWDLVEAFIETLDDEEAPSPAFLAEVVQEVARLLRLVNNVDQEEYVDLALEVLLSVMPDISEDVQLAIRTLAAQDVPAIANILISVIEKIDADVIEKIFTLVTMNPEDSSKVTSDLDVYFNPDFIILVAQLYEEVLADAVLSMVEELEDLYEMAVQFYPEMVNFDFEEIKEIVTALNDGIIEIAEYEIISEGYYETEQVEKIIEVIGIIENLVNFFDGSIEA